LISLSNSEELDGTNLCTATASSVFPINIETVWHAVRDFTFPAKYMTPVESVTMLENKSPFEIGAVRHMKWKTGEEQKQRLIGLTDQYYTITWETIEANHESESSAKISTIKLFRITETDQTLVQWSAEHASDVTHEALKFERKAFQENLHELRKGLEKK